MRDTPMGSGPQHTPKARSVAPRESGDPKTEPAKRTAIRTPGDKERPAMKEVQRKQAPWTRETPKHKSVQKPW